jgi:hypothetical protein
MSEVNILNESLTEKPDGIITTRGHLEKSKRQLITA